MSREGTGDVSVFSDPEYRERYREKFLEAQKRGMDMVVYPDGTIALIENKMVMHTYGWHERRRDFERTRGVVPSAKRSSGGISASKAAVGEVGVPSVAEETEYV